jgi:SpoVK/Ycf46/Vps4 family AAA+-type ATPase
MKQNRKMKTKEYLINGDNYFPNVQAERCEGLPAGAYECSVTMEGAAYFRPINIITDTIVDIPDYAINEIVDDVRVFWSDKVTTKFKEYGLVKSRGIIGEGIPGSGKTIALAKTAKMVINEFDGVVLFNPPVSTLKEFLRVIKEIEPNKKVMVMWEEFDSILQGDESELLSLLDGEVKVDNIIYLATTNYISRIPSRIKNRPSRFAKVVNFGVPSKEARECFLKAKLHESDSHLLSSLLDASEGFVIDQVKDLIISVCCFGYDIAESVRKINAMQEDSVGIDDFNESQAKEYFSSSTKKGSGYRGPLRPIR